MTDDRRRGREERLEEHACSCRSCRSRWLAFGPRPELCPFCGGRDLRIKTSGNPR